MSTAVSSVRLSWADRTEHATLSSATARTLFPPVRTLTIVNAERKIVLFCWKNIESCHINSFSNQVTSPGCEHKH